MVIKKCERCNKEISVRQADINRGWGRFCSKSCKAKKQAQRRPYTTTNNNLYDNLEDYGHPMDDGYLGHGQS